MNTLIIQDVFAPYYAGRPGYGAPDLAKRRKRAGAADKDGEAKRNDAERPEQRHEAVATEH